MAAMSESAVVTVRGLRKVYGTRVVVDSLDLDVPAGQVVGLIGANGAGKTTTVECIQGLRRPDGGTVRVLGLDPAAQAGRLRPQLGSQLQDSALPDRLRVGEALELFATDRLGGRRAAARGRDDGPAGDARAGRGRGAVRQRHRDARRAGRSTTPASSPNSSDSKVASSKPANPAPRITMRIPAA
jgi:energy-coupling factor transporter ATP-binding protein EcfA2